MISSLEIEYVDAQEKDVGMAVDMDLARRAAVFLGNGVSLWLLTFQLQGFD